MATVVKKNGGQSGGEPANKTLLIAILIAVIVLCIGVALYAVVPRTPRSDGITATQREMQEEQKLTPEERTRREAEERQEDLRGRSGTDQEGSR
jgi:cell division protein FtsN